MRTVPVDDPADGRLADYRHLTDADLRRAIEDPRAGAGLFVAEGVLAIRRLLASRYPVRSVLVTPRRLEDLEPDLDGVDAPVYVASRDVMASVAGFDVHRGALASAARLPPASPARLIAPARRLAVLEGLNDHENLGVIFRNAAALGVDGVLLCPRTADPLYRRTVRVSLGHVLHVPFARLAPWPAALEDVRAAGFTLVALTPDTAATSIGEAALASAERLALLLGAEGAGLTPEVVSLAEVRVRIEMGRDVDSLNVASAAAIAFHAARRPTA